MIPVLYIQYKDIYDSTQRSYYESVIVRQGGRVIPVYITHEYEQNNIPLHESIQQGSVYLIDVRVPRSLEQNLHAYLSAYGLTHFYNYHNSSHDDVVHSVYLRKRNHEYVHSEKEDIEEKLAILWKKHFAPIYINFRGIQHECKTMSDLRRVVETVAIHKEPLVVQERPKGKKYEISFVRDVRNQSVYTTPVVDVTHTNPQRVTSREIIEHIEHATKAIASRLHNYPMLTCTIIDTPKGMYLDAVYTAPYTKNKKVHSSLEYVGLQPRELTSALFAFHALSHSV